MVCHVLAAKKKQNLVNNEAKLLMIKKKAADLSGKIKLKRERNSTMSGQSGHMV